MRIIRGKYSGRRIKPPKSLKARPTTDFAKEGLFNIIENNISQEERKTMRVLDLFAGTGNISYEFLSRGFASAVAVEISRNHSRFIHKTSTEIFENTLEAITGDAFKYIKKANINFEIIFADPPYHLEGINEIPNIIFARESCNPSLWLIIEHSKATDYSKQEHFTGTRKYGKVNFSFFRKKSSDA